MIWYSYVIWYDVAYWYNTMYDMIWYHIAISYHTLYYISMLYHIIHCIISVCYIISYHIAISYHIISYHIISYHIIAHLKVMLGLFDQLSVHRLLPHYRMCSLTIECVLLLQNAFSYYALGAWCSAIGVKHSSLCAKRGLWHGQRDLHTCMPKEAY